MKLTIKRRKSDGWWNVATPDRPGGNPMPGMIFETHREAVAAASATPEQIIALALERLEFCDALEMTTRTISRSSGVDGNRIGRIRKYRKLDIYAARHLLAVKPEFDDYALIRIEWSFLRGCGLSPDETRDRLTAEYGWDRETITRASRGAHANRFAA